MALQHLQDNPDLYVKNGMVHINTPQIQKRLLEEAHLQCNITLNAQPKLPQNETACRGVWDTIACWPDASPGEILMQPCPKYANLFNIAENVTRTCTENGTWFPHPNTGEPGWSNYSRCHIKPLPPSVDLLEEHIPRITVMYNVGYGVSLSSLIIAVFIMLYFKKLFCPRNTLHLNLFLSFILRAVMSFVKDNLFIKKLGLKQDVYVTTEGKYFFIDEHAVNVTHWECKTVWFVFIYSLSANYIWIFIEGLYLHTLIFVSVFSEKYTIKWYIIFGWLSPLSFLLPWAGVRAALNNIYCWNISQPKEGYEWIITGPLLAFILINFGFFINIVRVLFTKLRASHTPEGKKYRYKRLAKSTLVLIPLFGVHYILFSLVPERHVNDTVQVIKLYFEMLCNSFQGFLVALLYCFLNGEVQSEIKKKWNRFQLEREGPHRQYSKSMNDSENLMNGNGLLTSMAETTTNYHPGSGEQYNKGKQLTRHDPSPKEKSPRTREAERGKLLLEAADDYYFMSEGCLTETSCFNDSALDDTCYPKANNDNKKEDKDEHTQDSQI